MIWLEFRKIAGYEKEGLLKTCFSKQAFRKVTSNLNIYIPKLNDEEWRKVFELYGYLFTFIYR